MKPRPTKVGKIIREYREAKGLTQDDLAKALGYKNKSSIARLENGSSTLNPKKVHLFAATLGIDSRALNEALHEDFANIVCDEKQKGNIVDPTLLEWADKDIIESRNYLVHFSRDGRAEMILQEDIDPRTRRLLKYLELLSNESQLELLKRAEELVKLQELNKPKDDEK